MVLHETQHLALLEDLEDGPQSLDVGGEGGVEVEDDDLLDAGWQDLGQCQLQKPVHVRVVLLLVRDLGDVFDHVLGLVEAEADLGMRVNVMLLYITLHNLRKTPDPFSIHR